MSLSRRGWQGRDLEGISGRHPPISSLPCCEPQPLGPSLTRPSDCDTPPRHRPPPRPPQAFIVFETPDEARRATQKDRETFGDKFGDRYVRVYPTLESDVSDMQAAVVQQQNMAHSQVRAGREVCGRAPHGVAAAVPAALAAPAAAIRLARGGAAAGGGCDAPPGLGVAVGGPGRWQQACSHWGGGPALWAPLGSKAAPREEAACAAGQPQWGGVGAQGAQSGGRWDGGRTAWAPWAPWGRAVRGERR